MKAYLDGMKRYGVLQGRSSRPQYWLFLLFTLIALFCGQVFDDMAGTNFGNDDDPGLIVMLVLLAHLIPGVAVFVRRLHDIGMSGWWILIGLVPGVGQVILIVFACTPSKAAPNAHRLPNGPFETTWPQHVASEPVMGYLLQPQNVGPRSPIANTSAHMSAVSASIAASRTTVEQLERLASLRASGIIDETEYKQLKGDVLNDVGL